MYNKGDRLICVVSRGTRYKKGDIFIFEKVSSLSDQILVVRTLKGKAISVYDYKVIPENSTLLEKIIYGVL